MATQINNQVTDKIWDAVEHAIDTGVTVEQFKREVSQAWIEKRRQDTESDNAELSKW